jgi:hypothetical protein
MPSAHEMAAPISRNADAGRCLLRTPEACHNETHETHGVRDCGRRLDCREHTPCGRAAPNIVTRWNQILQTLFGPGPGLHLRALPMMHIAMFDAINSIEDVYTPYRVRVTGSHGASAEAAAAQAARDVLTALYPAQQATFDAALASQLASLPPGLVQQGRAIGRRAAEAVLVRADEDLNPDTASDPTWTPLLMTPTYPTYAGNAACLSAAAARALQLTFGRDDLPFSITFPRTMSLPSVTRDFTGFWQLADQQARSRIYGGIHFQFDSDASQGACVKVPEFTEANFMVRRER